MIFEKERVLFLDDQWVESSENVTSKLNLPVKRGPIACTEQKWELQPLGGVRGYGVVKWRDRYRFYYSVHAGPELYCLAFLESDDGVEWSRPELDVVSFQGSTKNNLVDVGNHWVKGLTIFVDPIGSDEHRFKLLGHNPREGLFLLTSPDGLRFTRQNECIAPFNTDSLVSAFYDPSVACYRVYLRAWDRTRPIDKIPGSRVVALAEIDTPFDPIPLKVNPPDPWPQKPKKRMFGDVYASPMRRLNREIEPYVLFCDETDPEKSDIYQSAALHYCPKTYLAFPTLYCHYPPPPEGFINDGVLDIQFASSRDGVVWNREHRGPYVRHDQPDGNCTKFLHMLNGVAIRNHSISQYHVGSRRSHGQGRTELDPKPDPTPPTVGAPIAYRLEQRLDGFISLDSAHSGGTVVTKAFELDCSKLQVNIDTSASGSARAGLLDESGVSIEGFGITESDKIQSNDTAYTLSWNGNSEVSRLLGRKVKLILESRATKLYAVYHRGR